MRAEAELVQHDIEVAQGAAVAPVRPLHVERRVAKAVRHRGHLGRWNEQEHGCRVNEAADQPAASDAVHLGPGARDPERAALGVARRRVVGSDEWSIRRGPRLEAALQSLILSTARGALQSRTVILGRPTTEQLEIYAKVAGVYLRIIDLCRPGALTSHIRASTTQ